MGQNVLEQILEGSMKPTDLPFETLRDITDNFSEKRIIGEGGFGTVYKGVLRNGNNVAVKKIKSSMTIDEKLFHREVDSLMEVNHRNAVRFLGFCSHTVHAALKNPQARGYIYAEKRERLLCFEYINKGSLDNYITDELRGLDWDTRFQIIKGICMGLCYLHMEKHIMHMDLKPANILLDHQMVPKIMDFGLSRPTENSHTTSTTNFCTPGYAAPENMIIGGRMSVSSDIYSLGTIILELVTGVKKIPVNGNNVLRRWRHRWNKSVNEMQHAYQRQITKCIKIGRLCCERDPGKRPSISNILDEIRVMESMNDHFKNADESIVGQINPPYLADDMLGIEPLELQFAISEHDNKKILSCSVELSNDTCSFIAFKIQITSQLPSSVEPNKGIVGPRSKYIVRITMHNDMPALRNSIKQYIKNIIVRSIKVDEGLTTEYIDQVIDTSMADEVHLTVASDNQLPGSCAAEEIKEVVPGVLRVHPLELQFPFKPNKYMSCPLCLTNNTNECVAFRLQKKGGNHLHYVGYFPIHGVVPPRSTYTLAVTISEMEDLPREREFGLILHTIVVNGNIKPFKDNKESDKLFEQAEELGDALNKIILKVVCNPQEGTKTKIMPLTEHTTIIWCLDAHPTEGWIIMGDSDRRVFIWHYDTQTSLIPDVLSTVPQSIWQSFSDLFTEEALHTSVVSTKIVARKQWILAGDGNGYIHVYCYGAKPKKIRSFKGSSSSQINSLSIHPTKPYVLSATWLYIDLWDWDNDWKHIRTFKGHSDTVLQVAFNPMDHDSFVSTSSDNTIKVWSLDCLESSYILLGHLDNVNCLDFFTRNDQQYLITGSSDRTAKIWAMHEQTCIHTIEDLASPCTCVIALSDRPYLLTGTEDGLVCLWSSSDYRLERIFDIGIRQCSHVILWKIISLKYLTESNRIVIGHPRGVSIMDIDDEEVVASKAKLKDPFQARVLQDAARPGDRAPNAWAPRAWILWAVVVCGVVCILRAPRM